MSDDVILRRIMSAENAYEWIFVSLVSAVIFSYINIIFFVRLFKIEANVSQKLSAVIFSASARFISTLLIPVPYYRAINIISAILVFKIFLKQNLEKCILGEIINSLSIISVEVCFSKLFVNIFDNIISYPEGMYDYKYRYCLSSIISLIRMIIYYIIVKRNITIEFSNHLSFANKSRIIFVSILGISIIFFNSIEMTMYISDFPYSIFILDIVSLVVYFIVSIGNIIRISALEEKDRQIQNLEAYNKTLSNMYDSMRGFKHDFANFVQSLNGYVQVNDIEGIKTMSKSIFDDCKSVNNLEILDPKIINNAAIYSTLINKYYLAKKNNIQIDMEVMVDFNGMKKYSYEICRILGILLDNAIEAAKQCDEKFVNVRFIQEKNRKVVIIENSYNHVDIDMDKLFDKGYTTKKDTKNEHGLGLWTVKKILVKNSNLNLFTTKGAMFCQQLEIY